MKYYKTRKHKNRRNRKTYRRRYGGNNIVSNSQLSIQNATPNIFDNRKNILQTTVYSLGDLFTTILNNYKYNDNINFDINAMMNLVRVLEPEADEIDNYYGNNEMEDLLNEIIGDINEASPNINNNNETIIMN